MSSLIKTEQSGETSAFTADGKLVMNYDRPYVAWGFSVANLEQWLLTLDALLDNDESFRHHAWHLRSLRSTLRAAHNKHKEEHAAIVIDTPSADDLMSYLMAYATAMNISNQS